MPSVEERVSAQEKVVAMTAQSSIDTALVELPPIEEMILPRLDIDARPWRQFAGNEGVSDKVLWADPVTGSSAGLMAIAPGKTVRSHLHRRAIHHLCVLHGTCRIRDRALGPGSYVFVPAGVEHGIDEGGQGGCTLFFLYLRTTSRTDS
jgi:quercetin dioxygenase-like cupin family protein